MRLTNRRNWQFLTLRKRNNSLFALGGHRMGQHGSGATVSREYLDFLLRSARRAGTFLIVPHGTDAEAVNALTCEGYARRHLGHVVLTLKGQEHLRHTSRMAALSA